MTLFRLLPLGARSGLLIAMGTGVLVAPPLLYLSPAAVVAGLFIGVVAIGIGIAGTDTRGRGTVPVLAHQSYDRGMAAGMAFTALAFVAVGEPAAAGLFGAAAAAQLLIATNTRYSAAVA